MKWLVWGHFIFLPCVQSVLPTGILSFERLPEASSVIPPQLFCAPSATAGWGVALPSHVDSPWLPLMQLPDANRDGCASYQVPQDALVLVDRGNCSFVAKALQAQAAGARGLIVRGTKEAVYDAIMSHHRTNFSRVSIISTNQVPSPSQVLPVFEYDCSRGEAFVETVASPIWQTDAATCHQDPKCSSQTCILTGHSTLKDQRPKHQVCCMWDTFVLMGIENRTLAKTLTIPAVYVTIANGQAVEKVLTKYPTSLSVRMSRREIPLVDVSSMLLWALGVLTAVGGAYASVDRSNNSVSMAVERQKGRNELEERRHEVWELDARHAVYFIILAGLSLSVLYYVKIGGVIPVLYAVSGATTMAQMVATPALEKWMPSLATREFSVPFVADTVRLSEVLGFLPSCALALVWYLHRRTFWVLQDLIGICLCFAFLRTVELPNLKVATVLLTLAFGYDVFFVFLSPLVFGSSVMEDVATGGPAAHTKAGYPGIDFCERYPQYSACEDPDPMPMLLVLPRVFDWVGGVNMLGLGDIILPGMLLSFTLRFDYAQAGCTHYFRLMAAGYAVGLAMANVAVVISKVGQPALMYLVPTTLGLLCLVSKRNGDFHKLWIGAGVNEKRSHQGLGYQAVRAEGPTEIVIGHG